MRSKIEKTVSGIPSDGLFFNLIDLIFSIRLITFLIMQENLCNVFVSPYSALPLPDLKRGNTNGGILTEDVNFSKIVLVTKIWSK